MLCLYLTVFLMMIDVALDILHKMWNSVHYTNYPIIIKAFVPQSY